MEGTKASLKNAGSKAVEGFKQIGEELDTAMKTSYIKEAPKDVSKSFDELREQLKDGMSKDEIGHTWDTFTKNIKEVFGNAKVNLSNKQYTNIFEPPKQTSTKEVPVPEKKEAEAESRPSFMKSEIYNVGETKESIREFSH